MPVLIRATDYFKSVQIEAVKFTPEQVCINPEHIRFIKPYKKDGAEYCRVFVDIEDPFILKGNLGSVAKHLGVDIRG